LFLVRFENNADFSVKQVFRGFSKIPRGTPNRIYFCRFLSATRVFFHKNWICYLARVSYTNIDTDVCTIGAVAIRSAFYPRHVCGRVSGAGMRMVSPASLFTTEGTESLRAPTSISQLAACRPWLQAMSRHSRRAYRYSFILSSKDFAIRAKDSLSL
jgi:hypothetical protein